MDAARITRLLEAGKVTQGQVLRAAVLGLVPYATVPTEAGDPAAEATNLAALRDRARLALAANATDLTQDATIQSQAQAIIDNPATTLTQAQIIGALKQLAQGVSVLAAHDVATKKELTALIRLVVGALDSTEGT